jgi:hypothetical protein
MKLITTIIAVLAIGVSGASASSTDVTATEHVATEICFPVADWNGTASPEDRPCDTLYRPFEDGSSQLLLGTIGADAATCVVPNVFEERGRFVIHCHRLPNR